MKQIISNLKTPIGIAGLLLRLAFLWFPGSKYVTDLFIPFLDHAVLNPSITPWQGMDPHMFPYGIVLFGLVFIPRYIAFLLFGPVVLGSGVMGIVLLKLPLLILDICFWAVLKKSTEKSSKQIDLLYWLNPVAIYITYIHGQLDIAATFFCFLSIIFLHKGWIKRSAIAFVAATLCKFHVLVIIPFLLAYLWNWRFRPQNIRDILKWIGIWVGGVAIGSFPHLIAKTALYSSVGSPEAMRIFSIAAQFKDDRTLFIGIMILALIVGRLIISMRITGLGLLWGSGAIFSALLLVTDPMPGWYFWCIPYLALFFSLQHNLSKAIFWLFCAAYIWHFSSLEASLLGGHTWSWLAEQISFTLTQTLLATNFVALWVLGVTPNAVLHGRAKPLTLGIAGDSGAGKNYFTEILRKVFGQDESTVMEGDDYHKWERFHSRWQEYTHLNPRANHLNQMAKDAEALTSGMAISHSHYDHSVGLFSAPQETIPKRTIIMQGLHTLYARQLRTNFDLKIFLDPHPLIRLHWKIKRDVFERKHTAQAVLDSLNKRSGDSIKHIAPQKKFADLIICFEPLGSYTEQDALSNTDPEVSLALTLWNDSPIEDLLEELSKLKTLNVAVRLSDSEFDRVQIVISGKASSNEVRNCADFLFPNLRHITHGKFSPDWVPGLMGVLQLFVVTLLRDRHRI